MKFSPFISFLILLDIALVALGICFIWQKVAALWHKLFYTVRQ